MLEYLNAASVNELGNTRLDICSKAEKLGGCAAVKQGQGCVYVGA
jgi:ligand-binding sensor protein